MDLIDRQAAIDAVYEAFCYAYCDNCEKDMNEDLCGDCHRKYQNWAASKKAVESAINSVPSAQPERTCVNCGRTANNGGWYADGGTRCPIEEHYALPKDGYCHLWEKRNVTDDDYPEGRADE